MEIFGFQKGKVEIKLPKFNFAAGETIDGTLELILKKPFAAKELSIEIIAEQSRYNSNDSTQTWERVFEFKQPLDGEKEYLAGPASYPFQITIPDNNSAQLPEGVIGTIFKHLQNASRSGLRWYLFGRLAVSGFDITKKVQINVT